ncbi:hypothetical protein V2J09_005869 [Rumex salicifolius]
MEMRASHNIQTTHKYCLFEPAERGKPSLVPAEQISILFSYNMDDQNQPIDISSSDSDIDFEVGAIKSDDDDALSTSARAEGNGEHSGYPQSTSSKWPFNSCQTLHTQNPYSDVDFQSSASQRELSSSDIKKLLAMHFEKQAFPPSFHPSVSYPKPEHVHFDRPGSMNGKNKEKQTFDNGFMRAKPPSFKYQKQAFPPSFHPSGSFTKPNISRDGEPARQFNGSGNSYPFTGSSSMGGMNHEKHPFGNEFMHAGSVDPTDPYGDEKLGRTDERSVFEEVVQDLNQPKQEAELPDGLMTVPLMRHQKIALAWMMQKEARTMCVGGILADDQGLGKTISTIALIQMDRHSKQKPKSEDRKIKPLTLDEDHKGVINLDDFKPTKDFSAVKFEPKQCSSQHSNLKIKLENCQTEPLNLDDDDDDYKRIVDLDDVKMEEDCSASLRSSFMQRPAAGTLVVCPASVLRQWARELRTKVTADAKLRVLIYHGNKRTKNPLELAKYDVVLTTYAIVANEVPKPPNFDNDDSKENNESNGESSRGAKRKRKPSKKGKKDKKGLASGLFDSECGTLARVSWLRVVLDEAQIIKNHKTKAAKACCGLRAKKRWCLSGTPLQNVIEELYSYFRFLKYDPYYSFEAFRYGLKNPISRKSESGYKKLQVVLRTVMLRRTKGTKLDGKPILNLPPKYINMESLEFTFEERDFYATLELESRVKFKAYDEAGTVGENYANILVLLLRLRQACDHPYLCVCGGSYTVRDTDSIPTLKKLPKDKVAGLLDRLQGSVICQCCEDMPEDTIVAICGHVFCDQCILERLAGDEDTCPVRQCKEQLSTKVIFSKVTLRSFLSIGTESSPSYSDPSNGSKSVTSREYTSSKIRAALGLLKSLCRPSVLCIDLEDDYTLALKSESTDDNTLALKPESTDDNTLALKPEPTNDYTLSLKPDPMVNVRTEIIIPGPSEEPKKVIVFSQWTRMLDLMQVTLLQSGINFRRLDGTMNLFARDKAVREFNTKPEVDVMLMSLKAGNLGLNMVSACHVIMLDLWWNPTTEDQAIDRAHRIGQTRAVTVSRLTVKDTVEDRILALQEKKRKMVASAYGEENSGGSACLSVQDLRFLFMGA